jgi:hypothetical protein
MKLARWFWRRYFKNVQCFFTLLLLSPQIEGVVPIHLIWPPPPPSRWFVPSLVKIGLVGSGGEVENVKCLQTDGQQAIRKVIFGFQLRWAKNKSSYIHCPWTFLHPNKSQNFPGFYTFNKDLGQLIPSVIILQCFGGLWMNVLTCKNLTILKKTYPIASIWFRLSSWWDHWCYCLCHIIVRVCCIVHPSFSIKCQYTSSKHGLNLVKSTWVPFWFPAFPQDPGLPPDTVACLISSVSNFL